MKQRFPIFKVLRYGRPLSSNSMRCCPFESPIVSSCNCVQKEIFHVLVSSSPSPSAIRVFCVGRLKRYLTRGFFSVLAESHRSAQGASSICSCKTLEKQSLHAKQALLARWEKVTIEGPLKLFPSQINSSKAGKSVVMAFRWRTLKHGSGGNLFHSRIAVKRVVAEVDSSQFRKICGHSILKGLLSSVSFFAREKDQKPNVTSCRDGKSSRQRRSCLRERSRSAKGKFDESSATPKLSLSSDGRAVNKEINYGTLQNNRSRCGKGVLVEGDFLQLCAVF